MMVALGLVFVAIAAVIAFASPFAGLTVYWAWFLVRPQEFIEGFGGTLPLERMLAVATIGSLFLHYKLLERRTYVSSVVTRRLLIFLGINYFSMITSVWVSNTLTVSNNLAKLVVFYFIFINVTEDEGRLRKLLWVCMGCMSWAAVAIIKNYIENPYYAQGIQRAVSLTATWSDPNATALNFVLTIPFVFALFPRTSWYKRFTLLAIVALFIVVIVITGSRTGFLLMVVALLSCALLSSKRMILIGALLLVVVFGWAFVPKQYQERYAGMLALDEGPKQEEDAAYASAYGRIVGWKIAWMIFKDYPVLGVGAGNFSVAFATMDYSYQGHKGWSQPHNLPGQVLSELGLLGALSFGAFVASIVGAARQSARALRSIGDPSPFLSMLIRAILVSVFLLFIAGFTSHDLYRFNWYVSAAMAVVTARVVQGIASASEDNGEVAALARFAAVPAIVDGGASSQPQPDDHAGSDEVESPFRSLVQVKEVSSSGRLREPSRS